MAWLFSRQRYRTHRATKCWNVCEANLGSEPSWYAQCVQPYTCRRHWGHRFVSQCYGSTWWPQRHLWLNLSNIKRKDKTFLMDVERSTPHGVLLPLVSSGDHSANAATSCASGHSGLRRAHISRSTRKRSGLGMPGFRAVSSAVYCQFSVSGCRSDCITTYKSRNQSQESGTSSSILTAWKLLPNISRWVLQTIGKWNQSIPISGSSIRPSIIIPHFHKMRWCDPGASSSSGYSHKWTTSTFGWF